MKRIMLYFGSFNPVHAGHLAIANYAVADGLADELWFVVSPQNPFKTDEAMASEHDRLAMVRLSIANMGLEDVMSASDIECSLPKPSYTIHTLEKLWAEYPGYKFSILMGEDNFASIRQWKDYKRILDNCELYVYLRPGSHCGIAFSKYPNVKVMESAPLLDISSTKVRDCLARGMRVPALLPCGVYEYIVKNKLYETSG